MQLVCRTSSWMNFRIRGQSTLTLNFTRLHNLSAPNARTATTNATSSAKEAALARHAAKVKQISETVKGFYSQRQKFRIYHGSTNSTRPRTASHKTNVVDVSSLNEVLHIRREDGTAEGNDGETAAIAYVEPNVPMDRLVEATLMHNLVPKVVMEFPGITVGGGYSGTSGESSSYKHGFFDRTISRVEMVLADGTVVEATPSNEYADLFNGSAGALGTMGITTLVELQLKRAKRYIQTTYHPVASVREAMAKIKEETANPANEYVDGVLFSPSSGAIVTGRSTDEPPSESIPLQTFSNPKDPWFYMHVQSRIEGSSSSKPPMDTVPLPEYLFRYDRGGFWVGRSAYTYFSFPFTAWSRSWLDDFTHTRMMYTALHASGMAKTYMVQDVAMPYDAVDEFVAWQDDMTAHGGKFGIWPLWLCPLKQSSPPNMHPQANLKDANGELQPLMNVGLWGFGPKDYNDFVDANIALERKLEELKGMKWLYAHTYYTEDEFWRSFDQSWYDNLRIKYNAQSLPSVYEKVKIDVVAARQETRQFQGRLLSTWPLGGFWGIWKAIQSGTYKDARTSSWRHWAGQTHARP